MIKILGQQTLPLRRLLSCNNSKSTGFSENSSRLGYMKPEDNDSFETFESVQIQDVDHYLEAILGKHRGGSTPGSCVNFLEPHSPKFIPNNN